ncbi:MAG: hypothetical protein M3Y87_12570 [Myxococcota bacterium]|nr:hypothetical protein [Myxococcota bacterium]
MERRIIDTITIWTGAVALPLIVLAYLSGGVERASGAAAGASLAFVNWLVLRWVMAGLVRRHGGAALPGGQAVGQGTLMAVLVAKIGFVLAGAAVMLRVFEPTGLVIGVSALVLGMFGGALHAHWSPTPPFRSGSSPLVAEADAIAGERD